MFKDGDLDGIRMCHGHTRSLDSRVWRARRSDLRAMTHAEAHQGCTERSFSVSNARTEAKVNVEMRFPYCMMRWSRVVRLQTGQAGLELSKEPQEECGY